MTMTIICLLLANEKEGKKVQKTWRGGDLIQEASVLEKRQLEWQMYNWRTAQVGNKQQGKRWVLVEPTLFPQLGLLQIAVPVGSCCVGNRCALAQWRAVTVQRTGLFGCFFFPRKMIRRDLLFLDVLIWNTSSTDASLYSDRHFSPLVPHGVSPGYSTQALGNTEEWCCWRPHPLVLQRCYCWLY